MAVLTKNNTSEIKTPRKGNQADRSHRPPPEFSEPARALYCGLDRIGSIRRTFDRWLAVDRLNREIGTFSTEDEAISAIDAAAGSAS